MNLEPSAISLREQFPDDARVDLQREEKKLEKFGTVAFGGFALMIGLAMCGFIYMVITEMVLTGNKAWIGILLIIFVIFTAMTVGYILRREALKQKRRRIEKAPGLVTPPSPPTAKLLHPSTIEPVPSVVEHTTELLNIDRHDR